MEFFGLLVVIAIIVLIVFAVRSMPASNIETAVRSKYNYQRKKYFMTRSENEFMHVLEQAVGDKYVIFPQVHLDAFLDHKIGRQDWRAALSTIQRKSVDYLLCTRDQYCPVVAIELNGSSHDLPDRYDRDEKVKAIMINAGMPLIRVRRRDVYNVEEIRSGIEEYLGSTNQQ